MKRHDHVPQPFISGCGCIITTEATLWNVGLFDRRVEVKVTTTFCPEHRERNRGGGCEETSTFRTNCKLCIFYFAMGWIAVAGWIVTGILLWRAS